MPYSKKAKFLHKRQRNPEQFDKFYTVPISHVPHRKKYPKGTEAIIGHLIGDGWKTQSILVLKKKR